MAERPICSIFGCGKPHKARGWCHEHYSRYLRHGDPRIHKRVRRGTLLKWIHEHVSYDSADCLLWPFATSGRGYGKVFVGKRQTSAHRYMCELANGPAPSSQHVAAHNCGNGLLGCVNPKHLRWATYRENAADKFLHGTDTRGEKNSQAKLTESDVREIKNARFVEAQDDLARRYGVTQSLVSMIQTGRIWGWVT